MKYSFNSRGTSVPDAYVEELKSSNIMKTEEAAKIIHDHNELLNEHFKKTDTYQPQQQNLKSNWKNMVQPSNAVTVWDTGLPADILKYVGARSVKYPDDFNLHQHLKKTQEDARLKKLISGSSIDWGLAEALAIGSLLYQGTFILKIFLVRFLVKYVSTYVKMNLLMKLIKK